MPTLFIGSAAQIREDLGPGGSDSACPT
jgi:hypothetical protein